MAVSLDTYGPFDSGAGANMTEANWRNMMRHMLGSASGVIRGIDNEFNVFGDDSGMQVKVNTGDAWIRGHWGQSAGIKVLPIAAAHATLGRLDRVILRADFVNNRLELDVITGTAAASPAVPMWTQSTAVWETSLAVVSVPAADTSIAAAQVTNWRAYTTIHIRLYQAGAQSIANSASPGATPVKLTFGGVSASSDGGADDALYFTAATNLFTFVRPGLYSITANAAIEANTTGRRWLYIARNGEENTDRLSQCLLPAAATGETQLHVQAQDRFAANAQVGIFVEQNSGSARNTVITNRVTNVDIAWIGP